MTSGKINRYYAIHIALIAIPLAALILVIIGAYIARWIA